MDLSKCQERLSNPGHGGYIPPFSLLAVMAVGKRIILSKREVNG
jgi:hypothetical protein